MTETKPATLKVSEVAKILGISRNLVYQLIKEGQIPAKRLGQRRIVIPADSFKNWLNQTSQDGTSGV